VLITLAVHGLLGRAFSLRVLAWMSGALAIGLAWYVVVLIAVPGASRIVYEAAMVPFGGATEEPWALHHQSFSYYLTKIWTTAAPAALLLPLVVWRGITSRFYREAPRVRLVAIAFVTILVGFSALPQKQSHYLMPTLPLVAILLADAVCELRAVQPAAFTRLLRGAGALAIAAGLAGTLLVYLFLRVIAEVPLTVVLPLASVVLVAFGVASRRAFAGEAGGFVRWLALGAFIILSVHFSGVDVWERQLVAAARIAPVQRTPGERDSLARWQATRAAHPTVARLFNVQVREKRQEGGDEGRLTLPRMPD
jgi:hypothetical protein